ncbi:MAG: Mpo1-like protein [Alphaproteobacteria bacterium]
MNHGEFWAHYLAAHANPRSRGLHYAGTLAACGLVALAAVRRDWRPLVAAPIVGYGAAWFGHVVFERNRPATFGHPLWSVLSDFRMLGLFLSGRLADELGPISSGDGNADSTAGR